ncbi:MAG: ROK family protein [Planctomycetota bacterium]
MDASGPYVGIDLGGTNMQIGVVSPEARDASPEDEHHALMLGRAKLKTKAETGRDAVIDRLCKGIEEACADAGHMLSELAGVGIGAPGAIDIEQGVVLEAVNLRWNDVRLADLLSERLGVPVVVDNDVNVAVYGEDKLGAGAGASDLLGVWVGTGVGGGLMLNGKLFYGKHSTAGEIGHMHAVPTALLGQRSLEHNCSRTALTERLRQLIRANRPSIISELVEGNLDKIKSRVIADAYNQGDELTREVVDESADLMGSMVGGIVTLLSLDRVVMGGGLTEALGEAYVSRIRDRARAVAFPDRLKGLSVVATQLEDDAGLLGAALLAMDRAEA